MFKLTDGFPWRGGVLLAALFAATWASLAVAETPPSVHEFTLDNGLKLIVKEDHRAPVVVSQVWYKVGSSYEWSGITGISHMLEHMMFKGTKNYGPGEFSRIIAEQGGEENAFTSQDYTAYYQQLEKSRLNVAFKLEADRMANLQLSPDALKLEKQVVMEERRLRTDDDPEALTFEHFKATAYTSSPYRIPAIGWMTDIEHYQLQDLQHWYRQWYAPNNAVLVVVGDVAPQAVLELAKEHFGSLSAVEREAVKPRTEVPQFGPQRITVRQPAQVPYLLMGYKAPSLVTAEEDWEAYALMVLAAVFDGNDSARFHKHILRGQQIAADIGVDYGLYDRLQTLFLIIGSPAPGKDAAALERAIQAQIEQVQRAPIAPGELRRIKTQVVAEDVYARDSVFYQAMELGTLEAVGAGWQRLDEFVDRIRAVTPEQVQAVARKYLIDQGLTVAVLEPQPSERSASHGRAEVSHVQ